MSEEPVERKDLSLPALPPAAGPLVGALSPDGLYFWDGIRWQSTISPDGLWTWNGVQWIQRQTPPYPYPYPQPVFVQQRSGGGAKGCLIASGIGFLLLGFVIGMICIAIGVVMIVVGAVS
jgi:hypothetical protein